MIKFLKQIFKKSDDFMLDSMWHAARSRLATHIIDYFGEENYNDEFKSSTEEKDDLSRLIVMEFKPTQDRPFWKYATVGITLLKSQKEQKPFELIALSKEKISNIPLLLWNGASAINSSGFDYVKGDLINIGENLQHHLLLWDNKENDSFNDFPNQSKREADKSYLYAREKFIYQNEKVSFFQTFSLSNDKYNDYLNSNKIDIKDYHSWYIQ